MANRHQSRSIALQSLFEKDVRRLRPDALTAIITRNAREFAPDLGGNEFVEALCHGVCEKQTDLDSIIEKAAPDWPIEKISPIDRNVLRVGLYELLFADRSEVPAKVAINEAIEIAKLYGGENSGRFVNGVLGAVYKELGEPGKNEQSSARARNRKSDVPYEELPLERLGGAVVYSRDGEDTRLAMVHDVFGHWTLSKGKLEAGEDEETGTTREIKEEMGLDIAIKAKVGENEYVAHDPEIGKKRKRVTYFLAEAPYKELVLGSSGGLDDARWFSLDEISDLNLYNDMVPIITKAVGMLTKS